MWYPCIVLSALVPFVIQANWSNANLMSNPLVNSLAQQIAQLNATLNAFIYTSAPTHSPTYATLPGLTASSKCVYVCMCEVSLYSPLSLILLTSMYVAVLASLGSNQIINVVSTAVIVGNGSAMTTDGKIYDESG